MTTGPASLRGPSAVLFDIDGTLLTGSVTRTHVTAMAAAFADVTGATVDVAPVDNSVHVAGRPVAGLTDFGVFALMCDCAGVDHGPVATALADAFAARYAQVATRTPTACGTPVPGAGRLLELLAGRRVPRALTTGNDWRVARAKLSAVGLADGFDFTADGGFGADTNDRATLARRALALLDVEPSPSVWLAGDTPADMAAAHQVGLTGVLVGSGGETVAGADVRVPDLRVLAGLLDG